MSSIARWSYTEIAEVKPLVDFDPMTQTSTYGDPFTIKCAWQDKSEDKIDGDSGEQYLSTRVYSTEDTRPKLGDQIRPISPLVDEDSWDRIRTHEKFPMSMFGKNEKPDFGLVT